MRFILADTNKYLLPGTENIYHIATIHYGVREFIHFADTVSQQSWVEEITGGHLSEIQDDELWEGLCSFIKEKGVALFTA